MTELGERRQQAFVDRISSEIDECMRLIEANPRSSTPELEGAVERSLGAMQGTALLLALTRSGLLTAESIARIQAAALEHLRRFVEAFDAAYPDLGALRRQATKRRD